MEAIELRVTQKLTPAQAELLDILSRREHVALSTYRPARALITLGYAASSGTKSRKLSRYSITSLGRAWLADQGGKLPHRTPKIEESAS